MTGIFLKILNMSISAGWLVLAVILLRFLLRKAPKWVGVLLWGIVGVRLLCPFSVESALSLVPSAETISPEIMTDPSPTIQTGVPAINSAVNPVIGQSLAPAPGASANPLQIWIPVLSCIWVTGVAVLLAYTAISYWRLHRKVATAVLLRDNIFQSEKVSSPFVLGMIRPKIYLCFQMDGQKLEYVVAHEQAHIRRRDHWWKPLGFLLLTIHWFNPLMWLAYVLLCRDIESACDEKVIKELGNEQRADYSQALLACSVSRRMIAACPLAFGETGVKKRVRSVLSYRKPAFWIIVVSAIICVIAAVCFLTDPVKKYDTLVWAQELSAKEITSAQLVVFPPSSDKQVMRLSEAGISAMVALINQSKGRYQAEYEEMDGGSIFFYITLRDGSLHQVGNIGNTYLVIDGDYYEAKYEWLAAWDDEFGKGNASLPDGYFSRQLTLDDVVELAQKGDGLNWEDFDGFSYYETGSGLYIRVYEIDEVFSLLIGGSGPGKETEPMYIYLQTNTVPEDHIDIRTEDVSAFISGHNGYLASQGIVIWEEADLDHDGETESIRVRGKAEEEFYELEVVKQDGTVLWSTAAGTSHVGWNTILLYRDTDGKDYLVQYLPTMYQGVGSYGWTQFSLEDGRQSDMDSMSVEFELPFQMTSKLRGFAERTNWILKESRVLLSTQQGEAVIGPKAASDVPQLYPVHFDPNGMQTETEEDPDPGTDTLDDILPLEFLFASGAGAWGTTLTLYPDGHFEGVYQDSDMGASATEYPHGTTYICRFSGRFGEITKISRYAYSMRLEELTYESEAGREWIGDQIRYIASEACGLAGGEEFILYLPDTPAEGLSEDFLNWWPDAYLWREGSLRKLHAYGLYNVNTGEGFFTSWW